ncbi:MAG: hypothetical protein JNJ61_25505 [Anaerolineae bacterium]|nr:hypothetical protein [Anaerolineae bacterium]
MHTPTRDTIERLTLRWTASPQQAHLPATHLRVERLLNAVEWQPRGMRPGEILLVRHLRGLPTLSDVRAWREQLQHRMDDLYRSATRPHRGHIDPSAVSVLFRDAAEFVACLTRDALEQPSAPAWFWSRAMAQPLPLNPGTRLAALWSAQPEALPAALTSFTTIEAQQAIALLTPQEVARVIHALHAAYALPDTVLRASPPAVGIGYILSLQEQPPALTVPPRISPPWHAVFRPAAQPALMPPAQYLLGLTMMLRHAPSFARSMTFAQQAAAWLTAANAPKAAFTAQQRDSIIVTDEGQISEAGQAQRTGDVRTTTHVTPPASATAMPTTASSFEPPAEQHSTPTAPSAPTAVPQHTAPKPIPEAAQNIAEPLAWVDNPVLAPDGIATQYGGVLYLINLFTWLGLPGEWENDLGAHLSGWALLEALARALLGSVDEADALWGILAQLDHRETGTPIGAAFPLFEHFRLPPRVLGRLSSGRWLVHATNERLYLLDEAGAFLITDVALNGQDSVSVIQAEVDAYATQGIAVEWRFATFAPFVPVDDARLSPALAEWLAHLLPFVRALLARQMPGLPPAEMLQRPGRMTLSRTHIDLYQPLDQIDMRVRAAGLDRDPAWVPDLAYIILFHFE